MLDISGPGICGNAVVATVTTRYSGHLAQSVWEGNYAICHRNIVGNVGRNAGVVEEWEARGTRPVLLDQWQ